MIKVFLLTLIPFFLQCATIVKGEKQYVHIRLKKGLKAENASASIYRIRDDRASSLELFSGPLPLEEKLKTGDGFFRGADYKIVVKADGYKDKVIVLESEIRMGWYIIGNLLASPFGGWVGFLVDPFTGAMWELDTDTEDGEIIVSLKPE